MPARLQQTGVFGGAMVRQLRLCSCALAVVVGVMAVCAAGVAGKGAVARSYVALGGSVGFGYSQQLYNDNLKDGEVASAFEHGYVQDYAAMLPDPGSWQLQNLACPGETTGSLIGDGPVAAALEASSFNATGEPPCGYQEQWNATHTPGPSTAPAGPLHVPYVGESQLEKAIEVVAADAASGRPVELISMVVGANDQLDAIKRCRAQVQAEFAADGSSLYGMTEESAIRNCVVLGEPALVESQIKNTEAAAFALRSGEFNGVPYTGKIIFQESYDPAGVVFRKGEPIGETGEYGTGKEYVPGSLPLTLAISRQEAKAYAEPAADGGFQPCVTTPSSLLNPNNRSEPARLQRYLNMANFTEFEGKKYDPPYDETGADGPDLHPTPAGYMAIAKLMKKQCGV